MKAYYKPLDVKLTPDYIKVTVKMVKAPDDADQQVLVRMFAQAQPFVIEVPRLYGAIEFQPFQKLSDNINVFLGNIERDEPLGTPASSTGTSQDSILGKILQDIFAERFYQSEKWGNDFDDTHTQNDWVAFITAYAGNGMRKNPGDTSQYPTPDAFRRAMVKVATLAVAAIEALDRYEAKEKS